PGRCGRRRRSGCKFNEPSRFAQSPVSARPAERAGEDARQLRAGDVSRDERTGITTDEFIGGFAQGLRGVEEFLVGGHEQGLALAAAEVEGLLSLEDDDAAVEQDPQDALGRALEGLPFLRARGW